MLDTSATPANGQTFSNTLDGFGSGDALVLQGLTYSSDATALLNAGTLAVSSDGTTEYFTLAAPAATQFSVSPATTEGVALEANAVCFVRGTRIATPAGHVAVEELAPGQTVLTADGNAGGPMDRMAAHLMPQTSQTTQGLAGSHQGRGIRPEPARTRPVGLTPACHFR